MLRQSDFPLIGFSLDSLFRQINPSSQVVHCLHHDAGPNHKEAHEILNQLKDHPDSWQRVDKILQVRSPFHAAFAKIAHCRPPLPNRQSSTAFKFSNQSLKRDGRSSLETSAKGLKISSSSSLSESGTADSRAKI